MQEMILFGVSLVEPGGKSLLLLKTLEGRRFLPIWIGHSEAAAIIAELEGAEQGRQQDLASVVIAELGGEVSRTAITRLEEGIQATITIVTNESRERDLPARPSDAVWLALRTGVPIWAAEEVLDRSAIEIHTEREAGEETLEEFRGFLDEVSPENFGSP